MIRKLRKADINKVADIWLDTNIKAHYFIPAQYWKRNFGLVKELLLQATVYVYEDKQEIHGQYLFIKEKGLKSSAMALMKLPGKEIMQWHGNGNRCHCECRKCSG